MSAYKFVWIVFLLKPVLLNGQYFVPDATVQALKNGDFRVYIPDSPGLRDFLVNLKINKRIGIPEAGDLYADVREKTGDYWIANFANADIRVGDVVYLWVSVIVDGLDYRKEGINGTITELFDNYPALKSKCVPGITVFDNGKRACAGQKLLDDDFNGQGINTANWIIEQWIPTYTPPRYIFNSYENAQDTLFIKNGILHIKPVARDEVRGKLDLKTGCTSNSQAECYYASKSRYVLPPVKSAKIKTKLPFKYGKVQVKAKFPTGDWVFPIVQLEQKTKEHGELSPKVSIAFSRGNEALIGNNRNDIGSKLVSGGAFPSASKTQNLVSRRENNPFCSQFRVYSVEWNPNKLTFKIDDYEYGSVNLGNTFVDDIDIRGGSGGSTSEFNTEFVLTLGVAVGGLIDFPDGYTQSNGFQKPWLNDEPSFLLNFHNRKSEWLSTWRGDDTALQVDYVRVTAL